jgi:cobalt-zinc-cadmium efflux system protein
VRTLRGTVVVFLQAVPDGRAVADIEHALLTEAEIAAVHHARLWTLDGEQHVFTTHLVAVRALDATQMSALKQRVEVLLQPFGFAHTTIEIELPGDACRDR